jgi:ferrous-iron efflux pump FieF
MNKHERAAGGVGTEKAPAYDRAHNGRLMRRATYAAVSVALTLIIGKAAAVYVTGSVAMLGTLFDSLLDGAASLLNLVAVRHALTPADEDHRFGHGKAEALAGLGQSIFILASAGYIVFEAVTRVLNPAPVEHSMVGIAVTVAAILVTLALVAFQRHVVARTNSLAIAADSTHYRGDLYMNLSVIAALVLSGYFGIHWADPLFGVLIAVLIGHSAVQIALGAWNQLMDRELSEDERERIKAIALSHPEVINLHDLRTRESGMHTFIQFHLELDGAITLLKAHMISDDVERCIIEAFPGAEVLIHQDPVGVEDAAQFMRA